MQYQSDQHTKFAFNLPQEKINIAAITWNLFGSLPPDSSVAQLFNSPRLTPLPDIIYLGTQQCQRSLIASFCCEAKPIWQSMLIEHCKTHFLAATQTMRGLHIALLVRSSLSSYFEMQRKEKMKAGGPCGIMGNKGAISVQFSILGQKFQFVNCHLAAHQTQSQKRSETINRVLQEVIKENHNGEVIFLGDFNYRIEMGKAQYKKSIQGRVNTDLQINYVSKLAADQLINQKELVSTFLAKFQEGTITFPPTYKIGVNKNEYNNDRIPGWTDRIFHKKSAKMTRSRYFCQYQIHGSDHRPVVALYQRILDDHDISLHSQNFVQVKSGEKCQLI